MNTQQAIDILGENIRIFSERTSGAEHQRNICIRHLMEHLCAQTEADAPHKLYRSFCDVLKESRPSDRAAFCLYLSERLRQKDAPSWEARFSSAEQVAAGSHGKIALVRNRLNEEAYRTFAQAITAAKAYYLPSFSDTCEDVFDNRCEFGILPVENTTDGKLFGFYAMLDRYELKICAACQLEPDHSEGTVRYALVGKNLPSRIPKHVEWHFECSVVEEIGKFPSDIVEISSLFDAVLIKIDSLPVLYDDRLQKIYFTFRLSSQKAEAFHLYLTMEYVRYSLIGFYPILT